MNNAPMAMRDAFLSRLAQTMTGDRQIFCVSGDFGSPVLDRIRKQFPDRFINVGIAEQNLINISAGLALEGFKVFAYAIAPFLTMRCYEQIRVSLALLSEVRPMNVNLIGVGAGYSYALSGPTHQCYEDLTIMRGLPSMSVYSPADHITAAALFDVCLGNKKPKYLRLDAQVLPMLYQNTAPDLNKGFHTHVSGENICLLSTGYMTHTALKAAERLKSYDIKAGVIDIFDLSDFNIDDLQTIIASYKKIITLEEGFRGRGGLDAMIFDFVTHRKIQCEIYNIGVNGAYRFEIGTREELHEEVGIGIEIVVKDILKFVKGESI